MHYFRESWASFYCLCAIRQALAQSVSRLLKHEDSKPWTSMDSQVRMIEILSTLIVVVVLVVQRFGVGLVIERSHVGLSAGALSSQIA